MWLQTCPARASKRDRFDQNRKPSLGHGASSADRPRSLSGCFCDVFDVTSVPSRRSERRTRVRRSASSLQNDVAGGRGGRPDALPGEGFLSDEPAAEKVVRALLEEDHSPEAIAIEGHRYGIHLDAYGSAVQGRMTVLSYAYLEKRFATAIADGAQLERGVLGQKIPLGLKFLMAGNYDRQGLATSRREPCSLFARSSTAARRRLATW